MKYNFENERWAIKSFLINGPTNNKTELFKKCSFLSLSVIDNPKIIRLDHNDIGDIIF